MKVRDLLQKKRKQKQSVMIPPRSRLITYEGVSNEGHTCFFFFIAKMGDLARAYLVLNDNRRPINIT